MKHASLFSGIGGPEVAAALLGWENVFHCEINPFASEILKYWFPNSVHYEDIKKVDFSPWRGKVDIVTGGFPCQPFSSAGKRRGADDERYLWPQFIRVIHEVQPRWIIGENVAGLATMAESGKIIQVASQADLFTQNNRVRNRLTEKYTLYRIIEDLESEGYEVQAFLLPAAAVGAPHRRDRFFIVAHTKHNGLQYNVEPGGERKVSATPGNGGKNGIPQQISMSETISSRGTITDPHRNRRRKIYKYLQSKKPNGTKFKRAGGLKYVAYTVGKGLERKDNAGASEKGRADLRRNLTGRSREADKWSTHPNELRPQERWRNFPTQPPICRGNDGLPFSLDRLTISSAKWRKETLKAYGNAIVPQVIFEIFRNIEIVDIL